MIEQIEDKEGKVTAYIEYSLVNNKGILDDNGTYIFVRRLWIWNGLKNGFRIARNFVKKIGRQFPNATHAYWKHREFDGEVKTYNRKVIYGSRETAD